MPKHRAITEEEPGRILAAMVELNAQAADVSARLHADVAALALLHRQMAELVVRFCTTSQRQTETPRSTPARMLRIADVMQRVGLGRSTVWRMVQERRFLLRADSAGRPSRGSRPISRPGCSPDRRCDPALAQRASSLGRIQSPPTTFQTPGGTSKTIPPKRLHPAAFLARVPFACCVWLVRARSAMRPRARHCGHMASCYNAFWLE